MSPRLVTGPIVGGHDFKGYPETINGFLGIAFGTAYFDRISWVVDEVSSTAPWGEGNRVGCSFFCGINLVISKQARANTGLGLLCRPVIQKFPTLRLPGALLPVRGPLAFKSARDTKITTT